MAIFQFEQRHWEGREVGIDLADIPTRLHKVSLDISRLSQTVDQYSQLSFTIGSLDLSTVLQTIPVGKMRTGVGFFAVAGGHFLLKSLTIGKSLDTGSPYSDKVGYGPISLQYWLTCLTNQSIQSIT